MTRDQISTIFTDNGAEVPSKGILTQLLNAFNQDKATEIFNAKTKAYDEAEAKYKDYIAPEDHQKIVEELEAEKGKGALAERKAKYQKANLNIDDADILTLIESKLKDSKDFDKDLEAYVKDHPAFIKQEEKPKDKDSKQKVVIGGTGSNSKDDNNPLDLGSAIDEYYKK